MIAYIAQSDGFALDDLIRIAVVAFFFLAPALRGILASRKQRREAPREVDPTAQKQALERWERMMRGELDEEPPELRIEEVEERVRPEPVVRPAPRAEPERLVRPEPALEPVADESSLEGVGAPRPAAATAAGSPFSDSLPSGGEESHAYAADRFQTELAPAGSDPGGDATVRGGSVRDQPSVLAKTAQYSAPVHTRRVDWRRAVVLSEFLATPVALRRDAPWKGR